MRPLRYPINVTLDGCCHHEAGSRRTRSRCATGPLRCSEPMPAARRRRAGFRHKAQRELGVRPRRRVRARQQDRVADARRRRLRGLAARPRQPELDSARAGRLAALRRGPGRAARRCGSSLERDRAHRLGQSSRRATSPANRSARRWRGQHAQRSRAAGRPARRPMLGVRLVERDRSRDRRRESGRSPAGQCGPGLHRPWLARSGARPTPHADGPADTADPPATPHLGARAPRPARGAPSLRHRGALTRSDAARAPEASKSSRERRADLLAACRSRRWRRAPSTACRAPRAPVSATTATSPNRSRWPSTPPAPDSRRLRSPRPFRGDR